MISDTDMINVMLLLELKLPEETCIIVEMKNPSLPYHSYNV